MKSWAGIAGYNLGTPSMVTHTWVPTLPRGLKPHFLLALTAALKRCAAQKLRSGFLAAVGTTMFSLVGLIGPVAAATSPWAGPARELGQKVAEITGPGAVAVEVGNRSSLSK